MEYISYILITLGILVSCLFLMRLPELPEQKKIRKTRASNAVNQTIEPMAPEDALRVLKRELKQVPTPWGWPGNPGVSSSRNYAASKSQDAQAASGSLQQFVDRLFREKHTVDNREYLLRKDASLRALVEDRFGRASTMKEIPYRKVKPPLLRDPAAPHDQMDNFPSGKTDRIAARIPKQPKFASVVKQQRPNKKTAGLDDMRTPWGW